MCFVDVLVFFVKKKFDAVNIKHIIKYYTPLDKL